MPVYMIGGERESLTMRSESFKALVKEYLKTRGYIIDVDSGIEGSYEDLGCFNPVGETVYVEAKDMKVGIGNRDHFLIPLGKHLLAYMNRRFKLVFAIRELRTVRGFKETFSSTVQKPVLEKLKAKIGDSFRNSGKDSLVEAASEIERIDLGAMLNFVLDTDIIDGKHMEWAIQERPIDSTAPRVPSDAIHESVSGGSPTAAIDDIFHLKDDISRKRVLLECISGPEDENLKKSLMILIKFFPDDYDIVSVVIENLDDWSDQTVEDAFFSYLAKTKDNRVPDDLFKVALDPRRGKPFRKAFFELLGEIGRPDQLDELKRQSDRERADIIKQWIDGAISGIKIRTQKSMPTEDYYRTSFGYVMSERVLPGKECYWRISDALREIIRLYRKERESEWFARSLEPSNLVVTLVTRKLDDIEMEMGLCNSEHQTTARHIVDMIRDAGVLFFHPTEGSKVRMNVRKVQDAFAWLSTQRTLKDLL